MMPFDLIILGILLLSGVLGFAQGAVKELVSLVSLVVALVLAMLGLKFVTPLIEARMDPDWAAAPLAFLLVFAFAYLGLRLRVFKSFHLKRSHPRKGRRGQEHQDSEQDSEQPGAGCGEGHRIIVELSTPYVNAGTARDINLCPHPTSEGKPEGSNGPLRTASLARLLFVLGLLRRFLRINLFLQHNRTLLPGGDLDCRHLLFVGGE